MIRVITFGSFDVFHVGHLSILQRAASLGDALIVGVSTDLLHYSKKGRHAIYRADERIQIVKAMRCVDEVFFEESLEKKSDYIMQYSADILVMGEDWKGQFDEFQTVCKVVYLPRTPAVSTTAVIERIRR